MRQELNLGPCPLRVRLKKTTSEVKEQARTFRNQLLRLSANREPPLSITSCFFRIATGVDYPYEVHLVFRDNLPEDKFFVEFIVNNPPTTWDREAKASLRKSNHDKQN